MKKFYAVFIVMAVGLGRMVMNTGIRASAVTITTAKLLHRPIYSYLYLLIYLLTYLIQVSFLLS